MWAEDTDKSRWIGGLVVDATAQRQGVGRAAVQVLLDRFAAEPDCHEAALSYQPDNLAARSLYAALGFVEGDEWADDEVVAPPSRVTGSPSLGSRAVTRAGHHDAGRPAQAAVSGMSVNFG